MLGPYADVVLLIGSMQHEDVRTDPAERPMLVADTLAGSATSGSLSGFASAHQRLPLLMSGAQGARSADRAIGPHYSADKLTATLFYDASRGEEYYLDDQPVGELTRLAQTCPLLSIDGAATAFIRFGVGE